MVTVNFATGATTANTAIGIASSKKTNNKVIVGSNSIRVPTPGVYEIVGSVLAESASAANTGVAIYANGSAVGTGSYYLAAAADEIKTVPLYATFEVIGSNTSGYATIEFMPIGTPSLVGGMVSVKQIL